MKQTTNIVVMGLAVVGLWYTIGYFQGWEAGVNYGEKQARDNIETNE